LLTAPTIALAMVARTRRPTMHRSLFVTLIFAIVALITPKVTAQLDAHSLCLPDGPPPDQGYEAYDGGYEDRSSKVISGVPAYLWHHGCGPTAAGMVVGYWDTHGYGLLIPGDASWQSNAVDDAIANTPHYNDYSLPMDNANDHPSPLPDRSEPPVGDEHASNCVGDFMKTSWSAAGNYYGWSWFSHVDNALQDYVNWANANYGASYNVSVQNETWGSFTWGDLVTEINANRPLVLLVDTDGNGGTDHFVTAIGYRDTYGYQEYACLDTWGTGVRWERFRDVGHDWGIFGATTCTITGGVQLDFIVIDGPEEVDEDTSTDFDCYAYYTDGSHALVDPTWEVTPPAAINADGLLTVPEVDDDTDILITATYSEGGITRTDTHAVVIVNVPNVVLESIIIIGPDVVEEESVTTYGCEAHYSDGSSAWITPDSWSVTPPATIVDGALHAPDVVGDTDVTISAQYSEGGTTVSDDHFVLILDDDPYPDYIHIMGPDQVDEDDCFDYGCRLYWSDGSYEWIDPLWSVSPDTYASINQDGVLCTTEVDEDQLVTITAEYTVLGIDLDAEKLVTIVDLTSPLLESIEIIGNGGVPEGEGAQYYCRANYDDGSQAVVDPIWSVDPDDCFQITPDGFLITCPVDENTTVTIYAEYTEDGITKFATKPVEIFDAPKIIDDESGWIEPSLHIYFTVDMDPASFNSLEDFRVLDSAGHRVGDYTQLTWPDLPDTTHVVWTPDDQLPYGKYQAKLGGSAADIFGRLLGNWDLEFWPTYATPYRLYVKAGSVGGDGEGWATALGELQDALDMARANAEITEIWVAAGTYTPDPGGVDRERSFELVDGVAIYGHFGGFESTMDQRDLDNPDHVTILSGDLLNNDGPNFTNYDDNSRHIMTATAEITEYTILDGFTIEAGGTTGDSYEPLDLGRLRHPLRRRRPRRSQLPLHPQPHRTHRWRALHPHRRTHDRGLALRVQRGRLRRRTQHLHR
jgi:hypothetical protein